MNAEAAIDIFKTLVTFALFLMAPFLGVILLVGLVTSLLQSITSIQEQTLTFVPKLAIVGVSLVIFGGMIMTLLGDFTTTIFERIPDLVK